ncbi:TPA: acetolactate synthase [Stenotrophomonas maltophilia]|nr:acetolactate synthase [Stenotrophomonas maltophilia]HEL4291033.1 acetolactate synthase [Stenotrophomonas maltophilia]
MQYRLDLVLQPAEGALLRVIGMAERRGFAPRSISGAPDAADDGRWHLQLVVDGQRPAETLCRQIEKIYDCVLVELTPVDSSIEGVSQ